MAETTDKWKQIETYLIGMGLWRDLDYETGLKKYKAAKAFEELTKEICRISAVPRLVNEADYEIELSAWKLLKACEKETVEHIKKNLGSLIEDPKTKGLMQIVNTIPSRPEGDAEFPQLAQKLEEYKLYTIFLSEEPEDEKGKKVKKKVTLKILNEKLMGLIYNRIEANFDNEKKALWAGLLAAVAKHDPVYIETYMNPEIMKERDKIEEELLRNRKEIANYIRKNLRDEEHILKVGLILYNANKPEA